MGVVRVANHLVTAGVGLLACTIGCSLLLLLRVATGTVTAAVLTASAAAWFLGWWLVLPLVLRPREPESQAGEASPDRHAT